MAADQLERQFADVGGRASTALSSAIGSNLSGLAAQGRTAATTFMGGLTSGMSAEAGRASTALSGVTSAAGGMGTGVAAGAAVAAAGIAVIGVAAVKVGQELYSVGARFDAVVDGIAVRTGKLGADLDALAQSVGNVASNTASSFEEIADITGGLDQAFDLTGRPLEDLTKQIADLNRMTGQALNIREFGQAVRSFGGDGAQAAQALDDIYAAASRTGIPIGELVGTLQNLGPGARSLGLDMNETAGLIVNFEKAGIDVGKTVQGLQKAASTFADAGLDMDTALSDTITQIQGFIAAGNEAAAIDLAGKVFGTRSAQQFIDAIRQGKLSVDTLNTGLGKTDDTISKMDRATADWSETWGKLKNKALDALNPIGTKLFEILNNIGKVLLGPEPGPSGPSGSMPLGYSPTNPLLPPGFPPPGAPAPATPPTPADLYGPNVPDWMKPLLPPPAPPGGYPAPPPPRDIAGALEDEASGGGLPSAPQIPYPAEYGQPPLPGETPEHWRDRMNAIEAQHDVVEKRARVDQLEKDNTATQEDITKARNDLIDAQMREAQASQQLNQQTTQDVQVPFGPGYGAPPRPGQTAESYNAEQSVLEAQQKSAQARATLQQVEQSGTATAEQLVEARNNLREAESAEYQAQLRLVDSANKMGGALDEIGAKLDPDFGISKGLAGIAENLTKFLANLAAAPMLGQLGAISAMSPSQGGHGLMGILGAQGAFGPQFTGLSQETVTASPSAMGPTAWQPYAPQQQQMPLGSIPQSKFSDANLQPNAARLNDVIAAYFPQIKDIGGYRQDPHPDHPSGRALDIMIPGGSTRGGANPQGKALGDQIWSFLKQNAPALGVDVGGSLWQTDTGGDHFDHIHARTNMGGPTSLAGVVPSMPGGGYGITGGPGLSGGPTALGGPGGPTGIGNAAGAPTRIGAAVPPPAGSGGGIGITSGGTLDTAIGVAASAADMFAPGAGQAAQVGIKLANRAIQYGGQVAGIGVQGLMETFLPTGGSELANNNWLTKIVGGIAGAAPALPNVAGSQPTPEQVANVDPNTTQHGTGGRQAPGPTNITVNNQRATEDGTGRDITYHLGNMYAGTMS